MSRRLLRKLMQRTSSKALRAPGSSVRNTIFDALNRGVPRKPIGTPPTKKKKKKTKKKRK